MLLLKWNWQEKIKHCSQTIIVWYCVHGILSRTLFVWINRFQETSIDTHGCGYKYRVISSIFMKIAISPGWISFKLVHTRSTRLLCIYRVSPRWRHLSYLRFVANAISPKLYGGFNSNSYTMLQWTLPLQNVCQVAPPFTFVAIRS